MALRNGSVRRRRLASVRFPSRRPRPKSRVTFMALKDVGVLVIGLGEIADLIVRQLKAAGAGQIALTGNGRRAERSASARVSLPPDGGT